MKNIDANGHKFQKKVIKLRHIDPESMGALASCRIPDDHMVACWTSEDEIRATPS